MIIVVWPICLVMQIDVQDDESVLVVNSKAGSCLFCVRTRLLHTSGGTVEVKRLVPTPCFSFLLPPFFSFLSSFFSCDDVSSQCDKRPMKHETADVLPLLNPDTPPRPDRDLAVDNACFAVTPTYEYPSGK